MHLTGLPTSDSILDNRHDFRVVNEWAQDTGWLHGFMKDYATYGVVLFALLMLAAWWLARRDANPRRMAIALWTPIGMLLALAISQPIAHAVKEQRPFVAMPHTLLLVHHSADYGFPSDHATMAGAVAMGVILVSARLGLLAWLLALLLAFARVYVGAHYPGDVLAGLGLGAVTVLVGYAVLVGLVERLVVLLERTPLRPLLTSARPTAT